MSTPQTADSSRWIYVSGIQAPQPLSTLKPWFALGKYIYDAQKRKVVPVSMEPGLPDQLVLSVSVAHPHWVDTVGEGQGPDLRADYAPDEEEVELAIAGFRQAASVAQDALQMALTCWAQARERMKMTDVRGGGGRDVGAERVQRYQGRLEDQNTVPPHAGFPNSRPEFSYGNAGPFQTAQTAPPFQLPYHHHQQSMLTHDMARTSSSNNNIPPFPPYQNQRQQQPMYLQNVARSSSNSSTPQHFQLQQQQQQHHHHQQPPRPETTWSKPFSEYRAPLAPTLSLPPSMPFVTTSSSGYLIHPAATHPVAIGQGNANAPLQLPVPGWMSSSPQQSSSGARGRGGRGRGGRNRGRGKKEGSGGQQSLWLG